MRKKDSSIAGIHFEGPFTSPKYGATSGKAWSYSPELCREIFDAAGGDLLHCTYAPELPFAPELEAFLKERGVTADVGHTQMSPGELDRAIKNGAKIVTHLFDAMGCWRGNDSISVTGVIQETAAEVALAAEGLYYELICDSRGVHVKPANVRLALRCGGEDSIIVITDCSTRDYNPEDYPSDDPRSAPDLNYNEFGELSGSVLTMEQSVRNFKRFTGAPITTVFKAASRNAAVALGLSDRVGSLEPGKDANIILVNEDMEISSVYFHGEKIR
jgi:N-acetylglucosamine-6-phosphate deacetylase